MKIIILSLLVSLCAPAAPVQYSIDWYKVSGGGGASSNGQYVVSGTIGQQDAGGPMTGGSFSLTGGFWSLYAVQMPGAPRLTIVLTAGNTAIVSWPSPSTGFLLQQNNDLTTANWSNFSGTTNDDGTTKSVTIHPHTGNLFFRLKQ
jgi:hypothetical protein